jgi:hypothetical protein
MGDDERNIFLRISRLSWPSVCEINIADAIAENSEEDVNQRPIIGQAKPRLVNVIYTLSNTCHIILPASASQQYAYTLAISTHMPSDAADVQPCIVLAT